jgi:transcription-repair coupling factor (superfamily II helicase)
MNIAEIVQKYSQHKTTQQIIDALLTKGDVKISSSGYIGSSLSFLISSIAPSIPVLHCIVADDREQAAYILNDMESIFGEEKLLFFPRSARRPYQVEDTDNANILARAEVLNTLNRATSQHILITYPEAINEKVITKTQLVKNTFTINKGEKLSIDFLTDLLHEYKFERVDYVYEPGQYSIRGGIIDVFSFSHENPYRIELFGNDVESIRSFDTVSQLSISHFQYINIIPNVQDKEVVESYESLLQYLPDNTIFWFKNIENCMYRIESDFDRALQQYQQLESPLKHATPDELFVSKESLFDSLTKRRLVTFSNGSNIFEFVRTENTGIKPQPTFNKNFDLLIENLKQNTTAKIKTILFADTPKQINRIETILQDVSGKKDISDLLDATILKSIHEGFIDNSLHIACYTDHQIFDRYHRFKLRQNRENTRVALTLKDLNNLQPGDYVTHIDHGVGRFAGLEKIDAGGKQQEAIRLVYRDNDILYVSITSLHKISKFSGADGHLPKMNKLGSNAWVQLKNRTKTKVKELAYDLIKLYAQRKTLQGFAFGQDSYLQTELEASFIYEDTPDQEKATAAFKKDMESSSPMDRLVCGDVGFGKTEVAIRAAFKAVADSKQVAVLVPTTILAMQHFRTFSERLKDFPCKVDYISRYRTAKQKKETVEQLQNGKIDIVIGTHSILGKDVKFKDLGLMIIDEEQKFGVAAKDKLKAIKANVDTLTLTATPIPRTLQFSMMGARDLSVIQTPPPNRFPVQTEVCTFDEEIIRDAVAYEISRGGQVFFIHNRVQNIAEIAGLISRLVPDARVCVGHGQMDGNKLEETMLSFVNGEYDVLVATTIIESGLDISNANTIIINSAHMFGLSDLHQMRGRVGRSNKKAFCYLLAPPVIALTNEARRRLQTLEEFSDLGSGFNIALRDLDIRGAGNLLGAEQSGFINEIGFDMYMKILDEAIQELREEDSNFAATAEDAIQYNSQFKQIKSHMFVQDCQIDTDLEILIPDDYVENISERLILYKELDDIGEEAALEKYMERMKDRFGTMPQPVIELCNTIRLRWLAMELGFEKILLKRKKLICYFISRADSAYYESPVFKKILDHVKAHPRHGNMKENAQRKLIYVFENIEDIEHVLRELRSI